jgi:hypothetical protein
VIWHVITILRCGLVVVRSVCGLLAAAYMLLLWCIDAYHHTSVQSISMRGFMQSMRACAGDSCRVCVHVQGIHAEYACMCRGFMHCWLHCNALGLCRLCIHGTDLRFQIMKGNNFLRNNKHDKLIWIWIWNNFSHSTISRPQYKCFPLFFAK